MQPDFPEGPERHLDAARQKLPRDNFCRSIAAQLPSPRGNFARGENVLKNVARGNLGGILRDSLGEGSCESKIAARQWGVNFYREASRCLAGPLGFAQKEKKGSYLWVFCLFSCVQGRKGPSKNLRQTLVTSDTRVSLVKVLAKKVQKSMGSESSLEGSEKLKKVAAVLKEKTQEHSRRRGPFSSSQCLKGRKRPPPPRFQP